MALSLQPAGDSTQQTNNLAISGELVRLRKSGAAATAPTLPNIGQLWFDTTANSLKYYNNSYTATTLNNLAIPVTVPNGGTGATTLTGILKGNGAAAFTAVTAPSGAIVGDTDVQTLTNKTLTTPTIGSFTNATHDHSNAAGGGILPQASIIAGGGIGFIGYAVDATDRTTTATTDGTATAIAALTYTFTAVSGAIYRIRAGQESFNSGTNTNYIQIWQGTVGSGTKKMEKSQFNPTATGRMTHVCEYHGTLTAGSVTINVGIKVSAGTMTLEGDSPNSFLTIERLS